MVRLATRVVRELLMLLTRMPRFSLPAVLPSRLVGESAGVVAPAAVSPASPWADVAPFRGQPVARADRTPLALLHRAGLLLVAAAVVAGAVDPPPMWLAPALLAVMQERGVSPTVVPAEP